MRQRRGAMIHRHGPGRQGPPSRRGAMAVLLIGLALAATGGDPAAASDPAPPKPSVTGALHGTVRLGARLAGRRIRFAFYPEPSLAAPPPAPHSALDELANVVVYLESAPALVAAAGPDMGSFRLEQNQLTFLPHVLPVVVGSTVEFPNGDSIYHNVFSLSKTASFDLGRYPRGSSRSVRFDEPGIVKVFCHIHSDMSAVVMVLDNPFFAVPGNDGRFEIPAIPPGRYSVIGWHERARPLRHEVTIEPGRQAEVLLNIPLEEIADAR